MFSYLTRGKPKRIRSRPRRQHISAQCSFCTMHYRLGMYTARQPRAALARIKQITVLCWTVSPAWPAPLYTLRLRPWPHAVFPYVIAKFRWCGYGFIESLSFMPLPGIDKGVSNQAMIVMTMDSKILGEILLSVVFWCTVAWQIHCKYLFNICLLSTYTFHYLPLPSLGGHSRRGLG